MQTNGVGTQRVPPECAHDRKIVFRKNYWVSEESFLSWVSSGGKKFTKLLFEIIKDFFENFLAGNSNLKRFFLYFVINVLAQFFTTR